MNITDMTITDTNKIVENIINEYTDRIEILKKFEEKYKSKTLSIFKRKNELANGIGYFYANGETNIINENIKVSQALKYLIELSQIHNIFDMLNNYIINNVSNKQNTHFIINRDYDYDDDEKFYDIIIPGKNDDHIKVIGTIDTVFRSLKVEYISNKWEIKGEHTNNYYDSIVNNNYYNFYKYINKIYPETDEYKYYDIRYISIDF
jgi:hypothetical protein